MRLPHKLRRPIEYRTAFLVKNNYIDHIVVQNSNRFYRAGPTVKLKGKKSKNNSYLLQLFSWISYPTLGPPLYRVHILIHHWQRLYWAYFECTKWITKDFMTININSPPHNPAHPKHKKSHPHFTIKIEQPVMIIQGSTYTNSNQR